MSQCILNALINYLKIHGERILSISKTIGQDFVIIDIRALYRYHKPSPNYPKINIAIKEVIERGGKINEICEVIEKMINCT